MRYTGVDSGKLCSVDYSPFRREWKLTSRTGRKIYVVPSHLSNVKLGETEIRDTHDLKRYLSLEVEERFGEVLWDARLSDGKYCLALIRNFEPPEDSYALDPEPFALARSARALDEESCLVLDMGRNKTTLVEVREFAFRSYRVVLRGGRFVDERVSERLNIPPEEAERLKVQEGLENREVRSAFEEILSALGTELEDERVLLSGGLSRLKGIESYVGTPLRNRHVDPELNSAFGAALKYVYRDCSPDFRGEELSERDLRKVAVIFGLSFLLFVSANVGLHLTEKKLLREIRSAEREKFRETFPNLPAIAVRDQVKSMLGEERYPMTERLIEFSRSVGEDVKLYRIEYSDGVLRVVGEVANKELLKDIETKSLKKTPAGGYEFEVELR